MNHKKHIRYWMLSLGCWLISINIQAQDLNTYIQTALENNPDIQAFELRYNIAEEKTNESGTLPNTQFGAGYFVSEPETRTGPQRFKLSVKQMLPWFGTITARENYASSLADTEYAEIAVAKRKLALSVSQSYYKLYTLQAKQAVLEEQLELIEQYEQLALTGVETGKTSTVKVFQLQIRENELEKRQKILEQEFLSEQTTFNSLLNRATKTEVVVANNLDIPDNEQEALSDSLEAHPELLKYDAMYDAVVQSETLNQKGGGPDLGIGLDYINVAERTDMDFNDNGKDILMPMVSLSIPIFNKSIRSKTKQNELKQQEITAQKQSRTNQLNSYLDTAINNKVAAKIDYETQLKNIEQAKNAEEILIRNFETKTLDFNDVLDILELQLNFHLSKIEAIKTYYSQIAIINYITNR
ncbi:TolC family protein [Galbibacter sp. EGI 63066]|uniref:TolC family protein n=1 Tax=Galbibacter sp. EGI 63066 TaxID=2993559 RepID=UPI0022492275|nr:TolC family protein [Galbibacter sp. EGI 63066]MCX2679137.1 TolC family protein [Galbibacter sp. EGI 63066]